MAHLAYIVSPGHSGSTTLTMLLGQIEGVFAAGELMFLPWQLQRNGKTGDPVEDLTLCTCRKSFRDCEVWRQVIPQKAFEDPYKNFQLSFLEKQSWQANAGGRLSRLEMLVFRRLIIKGINPFFMRPFLASTIAKRNLEVVDNIAKITENKVVIDSTKSLVRFHLLNRFRPTSLVVLTRDPRGLSNSAIKYDRNPERVLEAWIGTYERILRYIESNRINASWVAYEQMCSEPDKVKRFFADKFIGHDAALEPAGDFQFHLVAGNPSRYRSFSIREDSSWTKSLPDNIRKNVERKWHFVEKIYQSLEANCETVPNMPPLASFTQHSK